MTDNLLERRLKSLQRTESPSPPITPAGEDIEDSVSFGYLRGVRDRALMLELRKKNGNIKAFGYAWLSQAEFDPSRGIVLHIAGQQIRICGRNLNAEHRPNVRLFQCLLRHRVPWIQEADEETWMKSPDQDCVIEMLEW